MVSTRAAPSSQPGSTSFAPTTQRQPSRRPPVFPTGTPAQPSNASATAQAHDHKASEPRPQPRGHTQRQPSRHPPAFPTGTPAQPPNASATAQAHDRKASEPRPRSADTPNANLPVVHQSSRRERQPNRQTPAPQRKHTTTRQAQPASGIAVSTRAARSSRPGSTSFGGRDSPVISALTRSIPWKAAIKIEGFVRLSDISLNQPRRDPDTDHSFLFCSTSDTPGNERCRTSKSACGDRVGTFGHTESIPIPTQARGISI